MTRLIDCVGRTCQEVASPLPLTRVEAQRLQAQKRKEIREREREREKRQKERQRTIGLLVVGIALLLAVVALSRERGRAFTSANRPRGGASRPPTRSLRGRSWGRSPAGAWAQRRLRCASASGCLPSTTDGWRSPASSRSTARRSSLAHTDWRRSRWPRVPPPRARARVPPPRPPGDVSLLTAPRSKREPIPVGSHT